MVDTTGRMVVERGGLVPCFTGMWGFVGDAGSWTCLSFGQQRWGLIILGCVHKNRKDQYLCHARLVSRKQENLENSPGDQQSKNL